ncbi:uncharacterized protein EV420DRAFT_1140094 [Desarmillaria tabescens]|uniref:Uncharacterized protein n=1 Tax=Armillaria tabescens TaxID=1929756 RepID=A0AA39NBY2_ARMTA|nr:uncharacterized protein EV420DRAFT_1140094 [Desarmillaria tabescens]KAK0462826.1 hypothetical protein EV420DRAFT_1140094 [Desarmillaria tabescens]
MTHVYIISRMASNGASTTCTSEGGHGHDIRSSTERNVRVDENYQDGFETNTGLLSQPARATSVRRSSGDGPLANVHGEVERCVLAHRRTGRFDKSSEEIEDPELASPRTIPQVRCTDPSNTSSRQNRTEGTSGTANLPGSEASPSASFLLPSSLFTTSQTECNFIPNISALPPFSSANTTNNNSIIQYACNFAPNISSPPSYNGANAASAVHTVQIACNFTPNVSIPGPPSYGTSNAANSSHFPPLTSTVNQSRCNFTPILSNPEAATSSGAS